MSQVISKLLKIDQLEIPYDLLRQKRRTLAIKVQPPQGKVLVCAPEKLAEGRIQQFLIQKIAWIRKQQQYFSDFAPPVSQYYVDGEDFLFLGVKYRLTLVKSTLLFAVELCTANTQPLLMVYTNIPDDKARLKLRLEQWLVSQAKDIFAKEFNRCRQQYFADAIPVPLVLKIRKMRSRWGSYSTKHQVTLNLALIRGPLLCLDYVIIHELCHYFYHSHNADFYHLLGQKMPQWKEYKSLLEHMVSSNL